MPRPRKAPVATGEQSPMSDAQNSALEGAQIPVADEAPKPIRKFAKDAALPSDDPFVRVQITRRGADKISTGRHEAGLGDEYYAEGEVAEWPRSVALAQADGPNPKEPKDWVRIID